MTDCRCIFQCASSQPELSDALQSTILWFMTICHACACLPIPAFISASRGQMYTRSQCLLSCATSPYCCQTIPASSEAPSEVPYSLPSPVQVEQLRTDPLVDLGNIRVCMGVTFLESWKEIAAREKELNLPMYIAFSAADKVRSIVHGNSHLCWIRSIDTAHALYTFG